MTEKDKSKEQRTAEVWNEKIKAQIEAKYGVKLRPLREEFNTWAGQTIANAISISGTRETRDQRAKIAFVPMTVKELSDADKAGQIMTSADQATTKYQGEYLALAEILLKAGGYLVC